MSTSVTMYKGDIHLNYNKFFIPISTGMFALITGIGNMMSKTFVSTGALFLRVKVGIQRKVHRTFLQASKQF